MGTVTQRRMRNAAATAPAMARAVMAKNSSVRRVRTVSRWRAAASASRWRRVASTPSRARSPSNCVFAVPFADRVGRLLGAARSAEGDHRLGAVPTPGGTGLLHLLEAFLQRLGVERSPELPGQRRGPGAAVDVGLQERRLPGERVPAFAGLLVGIGGLEARDPFQGDRQRPLASLGVVPLPDHDRRHRAEDHHPGHDGDEEQQQPPPEQHRSMVAVGPIFFPGRVCVPSAAGHVQRVPAPPGRTTQAPVPAEPASSRQDPVLLARFVTWKRVWPASVSSVCSSTTAAMIACDS